MKFFDKLARTSALSRKQEQYLYAMVLDEVQNKQKLAGLWSMALAKSGGDTNRAESLYISLRVQDIKDDAVLLEEMATTLPEKTSPAAAQKGTAGTEAWASDGASGSKVSVKPCLTTADVAAQADTERKLESDIKRPSDMDQKMTELNELSKTLRSHLK